MTIEESLFLTYKVWDYLTRNPHNGKDSWPEWDFNGGNVREMENDCPCCEYTLQFSYKKEYECELLLIDDCVKYCPLIELWDGCTCTSGNSIYIRWINSSMKDKICYARKIRDFAINKFLSYKIKDKT